MSTQASNQPDGLPCTIREREGVAIYLFASPSPQTCATGWSNRVKKIYIWLISLYFDIICIGYWFFNQFHDFFGLLQQWQGSKRSSNPQKGSQMDHSYAKFCRSPQESGFIHYCQIVWMDSTCLSVSLSLLYRHLVNFLPFPKLGVTRQQWCSFCRARTNTECAERRWVTLLPHVRADPEVVNEGNILLIGC